MRLCPVAVVAAALCVASSCANITRVAIPDEATDWRSDFLRKNPNITLESLIVILHEDYEYPFDFNFNGDDTEKLKSIWPGGLLNWKENSEGWPEVPYRFGSDGLEMGGIMAAMQHWEEHTCVKFRNDAGGGLNPHVTYEASEDSCSSKVGQKFFLLWGQAIKLSPGCQYEVGVVIHEIGHALGLFHEQTRSDRDGYVKVIWKNMEVDSIFNNFPFVTENFGVPYDYTSIMHYGMLGFSRAGGSVLVTTNPMAQGLIGMRDELSHMDKRIINIQYGCIQKWLAACSVTSDPCEHDGYLGADCSCVCPAGTSGDQCQHKDMEYTEALIAQHLPYNAEVTTEITLASPGFPTPLQEGTRYTVRITAPRGKRVSLKFNAFDLASRCIQTGQEGFCCYDGLEMRRDEEPTSGKWYCGDEIARGKVFKSRSNVLVFYYRSLNYTSYFASTSHKGYEAEVTFV